jgi:membrane protease YdiL (CAAX protease family)
MSKTYLLVEFTLIFLGLPLLLRYAPRKVPPLPVLWLAAALCLLALLRDPAFNRSQLWNPAPLAGHLASILALFAIGAALIGGAVYLRAPGLLFNFVRNRPGLWALVMLLYPALSVYPQGIIYRAFLMHRYQPLFDSAGSPDWALILASGVAFSLMHLVFRNPLAPALTFVGGLIFAWRYRQTGSLCVSSLEHALYGCFLFTIGLGRYFYARAI